MSKILQLTTRYNNKKVRRQYCVIVRNEITKDLGLCDYRETKREATSLSTPELREFAKRLVAMTDDKRNSMVGRYYSIVYRDDSGRVRVECCRCGKQFRAYVRCGHSGTNVVCDACISKARG